MDSNTILSTLMFFAGLYGLASFFPVTGKFLFPSVYTEDDGRNPRRYAILFTGIFCSIAGAYSLLVQPVFT